MRSGFRELLTFCLLLGNVIGIECYKGTPSNDRDQEEMEAAHNHMDTDRNQIMQNRMINNKYYYYYLLIFGMENKIC